MIERFSWCSLGRATKYITLPTSSINLLFLCFDVPLWLWSFIDVVIRTHATPMLGRFQVLH
jgi:hypothetical protein